MNDSNFLLPEKWYIEITDDNREIVNNWKVKQQYNNNLLDNLFYKYVDCEAAGWVVRVDELRSSYTLITTEQFIEHVLHQKINKTESKEENLDYLISLFKNLNIK